MSPGEAEAYALLGGAYQGQRMPAQPGRFLRKAVDLAPGSARYQDLLAEFYRGGRKFQRAVPHYLAALTASPDEVALFEGLALSYRELGRLHLLRREHRKAIEAWERALRLDPSNISLRRWLEDLYAATS